MDHQFKKYRLIHGIFFAGGIVLTFVCEGRGQTSKLEEHVNALYPPGTEQAKTEALSRYAWGFYLSLNEDSDAEIVADQYLAAVANDPKSEFFVKELVEHWTVHNPAEQHERVIEYLADIACRDAAAVGLNTVVANAYMYEERYEDARQLLITVFDEVRWRHPHVIKQLVICHLKIGDINKAHRLVRRATKKKNGWAAISPWSRQPPPFTMRFRNPPATAFPGRGVKSSTGWLTVMPWRHSTLSISRRATTA
jgi:hypothetical protein